MKKEFRCKNCDFFESVMAVEDKKQNDCSDSLKERIKVRKNNKKFELVGACHYNAPVVEMSDSFNLAVWPPIDNAEAEWCGKHSGLNNFNLQVKNLTNRTLQRKKELADHG